MESLSCVPFEILNSKWMCICMLS